MPYQRSINLIKVAQIYTISQCAINSLFTSQGNMRDMKTFIPPSFNFAAKYF